MKLAVLINTNSNFYKHSYLILTMDKDGRIAWNKGNINKVKKKCLICGTEYEDWLTVRPKFCSRECYYKARKNMPGPNKGKKLTKEWKENIGKAGLGKRCGAESHFWKGGIDKNYPKEFRRQLRYLVKERDGFKCTKCGSIEYLIVHHIDMNKKNSSLNNLITLCRVCHGKLHNG